MNATRPTNPGNPDFCLPSPDRPAGASPQETGQAFALTDYARVPRLQLAPNAPLAGQEKLDSCTVFRLIANHGERDIPHHLFIPARCQWAEPPLVVVHGISRNAIGQLDAFAPLAERLGRVVIAPIFDSVRYRKYQRVVATEARADLAFFSMLGSAGRSFGLDTGSVDLFGFSGGAQFAHRLALLAPERVRALAISSAGWYTFPDPDLAFPLGTGSMYDKSGRAVWPDLDGFLRIPTVVFVGAKDDQQDRNLRRSAEIDRRQGTNRLERAGRFVAAMRNAALGRDITPWLESHQLSGCGHSFSGCVRRGFLAAQVVEFFERVQATGRTAQAHE